MDLPLNLLEYEDHARRVLPKMVFEYFAGGAADGVTVRANRSAFDDLALRYRVFAGVGTRDPSTSLFGKKLSWPVLVAPMAFQRVVHPDGELASVRGAGAAGTCFVLSSMATSRLEDVASAATGPFWFQIYLFKDRGLTRSVVERAEAAGCLAVEVTADTPVLGLREADVRNRFHLPAGVSVANLEGTPLAHLGLSDGEYSGSRYQAAGIDADLTWNDVEWLRSITRLPVLVKGVVRGDDAARAIDCGAAGVVVSNHGGRQLDTAVATLRALPEVVDAIAGRGVVLLDGGVRRGTDVLKALALGANAVQVGRPVIWGLALGGSEGVARVLELLRKEFDVAMALSGCPTVARITRDLIARGFAPNDEWRMTE